MPTPLEILIASSIAERDRRRTQEQQERERDETGHNTLFAEVVSAAIARIDDSLPEPLREFVNFSGARPPLALLEKYPDRFTPTDFAVVAPGLGVISFNAGADGSIEPLTVRKIFIGEAVFPDWTEAIAAAAPVSKEAK
jgi:hypothetical protein